MALTPLRASPQIYRPQPVRAAAPMVRPGLTPRVVEPASKEESPTQSAFWAKLDRWFMGWPGLIASTLTLAVAIAFIPFGFPIIGAIATTIAGANFVTSNLLRLGWL